MQVLRAACLETRDLYELLQATRGARRRRRNFEAERRESLGELEDRRAETTGIMIPLRRFDNDAPKRYRHDIFSSSYNAYNLNMGKILERFIEFILIFFLKIMKQ